VAYLVLLFWSLQVHATYRDLSLPAKIKRCVLVAEVRIDAADLRRRDPVVGDYELVCRCTILEAFKLPVSTNSVIFTLKYDRSRLYSGKTFLLFAVEGEVGYRPYRSQKPVMGYRPYGDDSRGLVEKEPQHTHIWVENEAAATRRGASLREVHYPELIDRVRAFCRSERDGAAHPGQPVGSATNRPSAAAGPGG
jgi:hypothetical protein